MKNNLKKIPLIFSAVLLAVLCAAFIFLYITIDNKNQKAQVDTTTWQTENQRRDAITALDRTLKKIEGNRAQLETHFAKSTDIVPFLDTIEKLAPKVGAVAQVNAVNANADNTGLTVDLKAEGNFEAVYKFLTLLENSPYELDFLSLDIHKSTAGIVPAKGAKNTSWEAVFKIQLLTFVQ